MIKKRLFASLFFIDKTENLSYNYSDRKHLLVCVDAPIMRPIITDKGS